MIVSDFRDSYRIYQACQICHITHVWACLVFINTVKISGDKLWMYYISHVTQSHGQLVTQSHSHTVAAENYACLNSTLFFQIAQMYLTHYWKLILCVYPTKTLVGYHRLGGGITMVIGRTAGSTSTVTSTRRSVGVYIYPVLAILTS